MTGSISDDIVEKSKRTQHRNIGHISAERGLRLVDGDGQAVANTFTSFDHFA